MNRRGCLWQLDSNGHIINDAKKEKTNRVYNSVISAAIKAYLRCAEDEIHSLYLTWQRGSNEEPYTCLKPYL